MITPAPALVSRAASSYGSPSFSSAAAPNPCGHGVSPALRWEEEAPPGGRIEALVPHGGLAASSCSVISHDHQYVEGAPLLERPVLQDSGQHPQPRLSAAPHSCLNGVCSLRPLHEVLRRGHTGFRSLRLAQEFLKQVRGARTGRYQWAEGVWLLGRTLFHKPKSAVAVSEPRLARQQCGLIE